jgi:hypothetical protein
MRRKMINNRIFKIISISLSNRLLSIKMGKLVEKNKAKFVYFANDMRHYEVYNGAETELE